MCCFVIMCHSVCLFVFFFFKQMTAYEMRISDWSSDVCSSDLHHVGMAGKAEIAAAAAPAGVEVLDIRGARRAEAQPLAAEAERGERRLQHAEREIGRATCRERVCQYV